MQEALHGETIRIIRPNTIQRLNTDRIVAIMILMRVHDHNTIRVDMIHVTTIHTIVVHTPLAVPLHTIRTAMGVGMTRNTMVTGLIDLHPTSYS